jgi:hypothetical protein
MVATPRGHGNTNGMRAHANPAVSSPSDVTSHRHFEPRSDHGGINSEELFYNVCATEAVRPRDKHSHAHPLDRKGSRLHTSFICRFFYIMDGFVRDVSTSRCKSPHSGSCVVSVSFTAGQP